MIDHAERRYCISSLAQPDDVLNKVYSVVEIVLFVNRFINSPKKNLQYLESRKLVLKHKSVKLVDVNANMTIGQLQTFSREITPHSFLDVKLSRDISHKH
jgi:hypothetical protein